MTLPHRSYSRRAETAVQKTAEWLGKVRVRKALWKTTMKFFDDTSMHGFRYLSDQKLSWPNKFLLGFCLAAFTVWSVDMVMFAWTAFNLNPIYVTLSSTDHNNGDIPFPGIAICSNNILRKSATQEYARVLSNKTKGLVSEEVFAEQLRYLGRLLDFEVDGSDNYLWLQNHLNNYDVTKEERWYNTYERMKRLAPHCEDLLINCQWEGHECNCSDLFQLRTTQEGFCCTFNYIRNDQNFPAPKKEIKTAFYGPDFGLTLLLNMSGTDYYYPLLNNYGMSVLVFRPPDYPDMSNGYLEQRFLKPNVETMVELFPRTLVSSPSVRRFTPEQRNCLFRDERMNYRGFYSQSDCLMHCRARSVAALCDCLPFYVPRSGSPLYQNTPYCNLEHVPCLNKYMIKLRTYYPSSGNITGLEKELQDSIVCDNCLPLCEYVTYNVGTVALAMRNNTTGNDTDEDSTPKAVVKIYYPHRHSSLYRQDVVQEWYNILSSYGGLFGICIGFSMVSVIEFAYFYTWRLWVYMREEFQRSRKVNERLGKKNRIQLFRRTVAPEETNFKPFYNKHTDRVFLQ